MIEAWINFSCLLWLCTKLHCFRRRHPWATLDQSSSSESGGTSLYGGGIPRAKLKMSDQVANICHSLSSSIKSLLNLQSDGSVRQLAQYLNEGLRIPRAHLHDESSLDSGSSEYTIREEIERRVTTDVTRTEVVTTEAEVHDAGNTAKGQAATTRAQFNVYPSGTAGGASVFLNFGPVIAPK